jgi:hypothetical protein
VAHPFKISNFATYVENKFNQILSFKNRKSTNLERIDGETLATNRRFNSAEFFTDEKTLIL